MRLRLRRRFLAGRLACLRGLQRRDRFWLMKRTGFGPYGGVSTCFGGGDQCVEQVAAGNARDQLSATVVRRRAPGTVGCDAMDACRSHCRLNRK